MLTDAELDDVEGRIDLYRDALSVKSLAAIRELRARLRAAHLAMLCLVDDVDKPLISLGRIVTESGGDNNVFIRIRDEFNAAFKPSL